MNGPRLPFGALENWVFRQLDLGGNPGRGRNQYRGGGIVTVLPGSADLQVYYRAKRVGSLTPSQADRLALRLGALPCEIWPEWFDLEQTA